MKITHTLVKEDGLYGMVMPEKPYYGCKQFNKTEYPCSIENICHCAIRKHDYEQAIKLAKDAAVRYEDQETVKRMLVHGPHENEVFDVPYSYANPKPSVYPLPEPLECEKGWQCKIGSSWNNLSRRPLNWNTDKDPTYRAVLRISQGTDNRDNEQQDRQDESDFVDSYFKVGGEEKKEHETLRYCQWCGKNRDVSEREEPTQEELLTELVGLVYKREDALPEEHERFWNEIKSKFIITRRA